MEASENSKQKYSEQKERKTRMRSFASCEKGYSKQLAAGYIVGMMVGSYFHKSIFQNSYEEKHLYLHYAEMPRQKQYEQEAKILSIVEHMDTGFLKEIENLKCEIHCRREGEDYIVEFTTGGFESLLCVINSKGDCRITPRFA